MRRDTKQTGYGTCVDRDVVHPLTCSFQFKFSQGPPLSNLHASFPASKAYRMQGCIKWGAPDIIYIYSYIYICVCVGGGGLNIT